MSLFTCFNFEEFFDDGNEACFALIIYFFCRNSGVHGCFISSGSAYNYFFSGFDSIQSDKAQVSLMSIFFFEL